MREARRFAPSLNRRKKRICPVISVQLKSEINGAFPCKRHHQKQHLEFLTAFLRTCTRKGRVPKGISTTLTIAFATSDTLASAAAVNAKPFMICFARSAVGPDSYSFKRALSS